MICPLGGGLARGHRFQGKGHSWRIWGDEQRFVWTGHTTYWGCTENITSYTGMT